MKLKTHAEGPALPRRAALALVTGVIAMFVATDAFAIDSYVGEGSPVIGAEVIATGGDVTATFIHGSGSYADYLYLDNSGSAYANAGGVGATSNYIFLNHTNSPGDTVDLGTWAAGTELLFHIVADTTGYNFNYGDAAASLDWYTGPASRNADGYAHAWVDGSYTGPYGGTAIGFEDLAGLGDAGYEDLIYTFSGVKSSSSVPDGASTAMLLGISLAGIGLISRRRLRAEK